MNLITAMVIAVFPCKPELDFYNSWRIDQRSKSAISVVIQLP